MDNYLKEALLAANVNKLPEKVKGEWKDEAIVLVRKVGGKEVYCLGVWNEDLKTVNITMDFDNRPEDGKGLVAAFPFVNREKAEKIKIEKAAETKLRKKILDELEYDKLAKLGLEIPEGSTPIKKAKLTLEFLGYKRAEISTWKLEKCEEELDLIKEIKTKLNDVKIKFEEKLTFKKLEALLESE